MEITVSCSGGLDWGVLGTWVGAITSVVLVGFTGYQVKAIRKDLIKKDYLLGELTALVDLHSSPPDSTVVRDASGEQDEYVISLVRAAAHDPLFDRVVVDFEGRFVPAYSIEYMDRSQLAKLGMPGSEALRLRLTPRERISLTRLRGEPVMGNNKQFIQARVMEGDEAIECIIAVRHRTKFSAFSLGDPSRIVIDLHHAR